MDGIKSNGSSKSANASLLRKMFATFLEGVNLMDLNRHGNATWSAPLVIVQALFWRISPESNVTDAHEDAQNNCQQLFGKVAAKSYQGLMNILLGYSPQLSARVQQRLRSEIAADPNSRVAGYFPLAVDGSKPSAPRTKSNEKRFVSRQYGSGKNAKHRQKKKTRQAKQSKKNKQVKSAKKPSSVTQPVPNVLITKFWNVALQLPWHWTIGGAETNERQEAQNVIETLEFPERTLIIGDAGFVGFLLWQILQTANLTFLIRAGSNVYLKPKNIRKGLYYYRPNRFAKEAPIVVRLVYIKVGKTKMAMLTNELDSTQLPKRLIRTYYEMRWGVEVDFRDFKQTFDCRKFRCKNADRVIVEANWSMLAFTLVKWLTHQQQSQRIKGRYQMSFTLALKAIRRALNNHNNVEAPRRTLAEELTTAITDCYRRRACKAARYKPAGERPRTGLPVIQTITEKQRKSLESALQLAA